MGSHMDGREGLLESVPAVCHKRFSVGINENDKSLSGSKYNNHF